jgi:uncharacterized protein
MNATELSSPWQPVTRAERYLALDVLRGLSLFGVLLVNLLTGFRVSLAQHILTFHTDPGWLNHTVDVLSAGLVEFKAFTLFSFLFGLGVAIQAERAGQRGINATRHLLRRFLVLLALGLCHLLLIFNGDILTLYAVCALLLVPVLRLQTPALALLGAIAIALPDIVPLGIPFPAQEVLRADAIGAIRVYSEGGFTEILKFRWRETGSVIVPLLLGSLPRTIGLMLCGVAAWRSGVVRQPERHRALLRAIFLGAGAIGATTTALHVFSQSSGRTLGVSKLIVDFDSNIPLAFAYAAGLLLWLTPARLERFTAPFAAAGQMALTNYVAQSVVLDIIFYRSGLFGRISPTAGALIGTALFAAQLAFSQAWLGRFWFGPLEWLWRSLTYGRRQPMLRANRPAPALY